MQKIKAEDQLYWWNQISQNYKIKFLKMIILLTLWLWMYQNKYYQEEKVNLYNM